MFQFLVPGMQHAEEADLGTQMVRIGGNLLETCRAGSEQQAIEKLLVVEDQRRQPVRKGKDQVQVRNGQELSLTSGQPLFAGIAETLRTMPVAAANGELTISCLMGSIWFW